MTLRIDVLTLFPESIRQYASTSVLALAQRLPRDVHVRVDSPATVLGVSTLLRVTNRLQVL